MHGTFIGKASEWKKSRECSVHHVPIIHEPIVGTLVYKVGDPVPLAVPAVAERCPICYPTIEAMMKMCVANLVQQLVATGRSVLFKVEKFVIVWADGRCDEHRLMD